MIRGTPGIQAEFVWDEKHESFTIPSSGELRLLAVPGKYKVYYTLPTPPNYVGRDDALRRVVVFTVGSRKTTTITLEDINDVLGKIVVRGPVGSIVWIEDVQVKLESGKTEFYVEPGTYRVLYELPEPKNYVGSRDALRGELGVSISAGHQKVVTLPSVEDILGVLVVKSTYPATVDVVWLGPNKRSYSLGVVTGTLRTYIAPGTYVVSYELNEPQNFIGDKSSLAGSIDIQVGRGEEKVVAIPSIGSLLGHVTIRSTSLGASIRLVYPGGVSLINLNPRESFSFYGSPGRYLFQYNLSLGRADIIGPIEVLYNHSRELVLSAGSNQTVVLEEINEFTGEIVVRSDPASKVRVAWTSNGKEFHREAVVPETGIVVFKCLLGDYRVVVLLKKPENFIGDESILVQGFEASLREGGERIIVDVHRDEILGRVVLVIGHGINVTLVWRNKSGGSGNITVKGEGSYSFQASPGSYRVRAWHSGFWRGGEIVFNKTVGVGEDVIINISADAFPPSPAAQLLLYVSVVLAIIAGMIPVMLIVARYVRIRIRV